MACFEHFWGERLTIGVDYVEGSTPSKKGLDRLELETLVEYLRGGGGECEVTEDIQKERWIKVIW
jgi:2-dehydropantoate 2-reductase